jgi:hypothetical protein
MEVHYEKKAKKIVDTAVYGDVCVCFVGMWKYSGRGNCR